MKYGILFIVISAWVAGYSITSGGSFLLNLWPALSLGVVGAGYLGPGHRVFGKQADGSMQIRCVILLLPYLLLLRFVWLLAVRCSRENPYDQLIDGVLIGRRLRSSELPPGTQTVVDLTAEFPEPLALRRVPNYLAAPMLDASALAPEALHELTTRIAASPTPIYIHCAQGHGRTGLVAALLLLARGEATTPTDALARTQEAREGVGLNGLQRKRLEAAASLLDKE